MFYILLSVPAISLFIFPRWRIITIRGIKVAAISKGHRLPKSQVGVRVIVKIKTIGNATEAVIEASEIYRHIKTTTTHTAKLSSEQIV